VGKTIHELLQEAEQMGAPKRLEKEAGVKASASSVDEICAYLESAGTTELSKEAKALLNDQVPTTAQELIEKVAESVVTLETLMDIGLARMRDALLKEAQAAGKTEAEINELVEKVASQQKSGLSKAMKFALWGVGDGGSVGAGGNFSTKNKAEGSGLAPRTLTTAYGV
jgi:hypothetical protein